VKQDDIDDRCMMRNNLPVLAVSEAYMYIVEFKRRMLIGVLRSAPCSPRGYLSGFDMDESKFAP
jgi:hypothetical protein